MSTNTLHPAAIFFIYLLLINLTGFFCFFSDKRRACRHRRRIPERTLFLTAVLGGGVGCLLGLYLFRHKTRHLSFVLGLPLLTALWAVLAWILLPLLQKL